ncbi:MAG: hypothetical protein JHD28_07685 [Bacteroidia bacterium]|nr:hypothetical protein [Bacteroidia bacterium]
MSDSELRSFCKEKLESLEYWLRRIIDETLTVNFGDYINFTDEHGNKLINSTITKSLLSRKENEPNRYPRTVDAILLEDAISIVCNPKMYNSYFFQMFQQAFPNGQIEARTFLMRLVPIRNALSHANPISLRQAEQTICYSNDIIDSLKTYYSNKNMENEYNVPLILKVTDSFGNVFHRNQLNNVHDGGIMKIFFDDPKYYLRVGDILTLEVEVDPSFDSNDYTITWASAKGIQSVSGKKLILQISEKNVAQQFDIQCRVLSKKAWHRMHMGADDFMIFYYKVLAPI